MAKLERLLNLMAALLETPRPLTAQELRTRIDGYPDAGPSFRRAFERDKDDLREMGVPISVEPVPGTDPPVDGYRIRKDDYYLDDPGLEPDELAALHLAASTVRVEGLSGAEAIRKLGGAVTPGGEELFTVPADPRLTALFEALAQRRVVSFDYRGTRREVEPARLDLVRGRWYLSGHDRSRDGDRHFRLDRIDSELEIGEPDAFVRSTPAPGVRLQPWELGDDAPRRARVLVEAEQAAWAAHHVGEPVERRDDGSIVLEFPVTNEDAFISFVLSFLDNAEILEPPELRDRMVGWLTDLATGAAWH